MTREEWYERFIQSSIKKGILKHHPPEEWAEIKKKTKGGKYYPYGNREFLTAVASTPAEKIAARNTYLFPGTITDHPHIDTFRYMFGIAPEHLFKDTRDEERKKLDETLYPLGYMTVDHELTEEDYAH